MYPMPFDPLIWEGVRSRRGDLLLGRQLGLLGVCGCRLCEAVCSGGKNGGMLGVLSGGAGDSLLGGVLVSTRAWVFIAEEEVGRGALRVGKPLGGRAEHAVARDHLFGEIAHEVQLVVLIVTPRAWEVQQLLVHFEPQLRGRKRRDVRSSFLRLGEVRSPFLVRPRPRRFLRRRRRAHPGDVHLKGAHARAAKELLRLRNFCWSELRLVTVRPRPRVNLFFLYQRMMGHRYPAGECARVRICVWVVALYHQTRFRNRPWLFVVSRARGLSGIRRYSWQLAF
mmetsp:Transcript_5180/g.8988  ORF Transcript_5180/g.8988 Transcript_5180/m.8988 type:complete len:281 (+) Transcript_5180:390-1232(+)